MNNAKKIFNKIKEAEIKPKSKWRFLLKNYIFWTLFVLSVFIGAIAFSVIIFLLTDNDWDIYKYLDKSLLSYVLLSLPYLWLIALILFFFLAYLNYKHTKKGYRINPFSLILTSIFVSILLSIVFFENGMGAFVNRVFSENVPYYEKMMNYKQRVWNNPEKGLLAGEITKINDEGDFYIKDLRGKKWHIIGKGIVWKRRVVKKEGEKIKIIGEKSKENNTFIAKEIRPWMGRGHGIRGGGRFVK